MKKLILGTLISLCLLGVSYGQKEGGGCKPEPPERPCPEKRDPSKDRERREPPERDPVCRPDRPDRPDKLKNS